ncbi:hypothetical protein ASE01_10145 [Nocardioides sp. Root190]|uniref:hypothetical protein n=1 Tax=Nocardioides sp. Root190 TaxID=1736488 RepID=UPI0006FA4518|nr:hypothetical protein [Nocardioides sp. Root190]KRB77102.1 hypothetical protein ASE01_10145 [Nocardioides sp. Root190]
MTSHRYDRLRVAAPTLEPDPVFLDVLADVSASSRPAVSRTARSAGLRMLVAATTVVAIAAATWAAGSTGGSDIPLSPADGPTQEEPTGPPSHGNVGTPQTDVSNTPGSPLSPGLPGTPPHADPGATPGRPDADKPGLRRGEDNGKKLGKDNGPDNGLGDERSKQGRRGNDGPLPQQANGSPGKPQR